jgi:hypothetical protein
MPEFRRGEDSPIPLKIVEDDDPSFRWKIEVGEELATPFNPSEAPLARAVLIQGRPDAAFILIAHHSIADGMSLAFAIRDTLHALAGALSGDWLCRPLSGRNPEGRAGSERRARWRRGADCTRRTSHDPASAGWCETRGTRAFPGASLYGETERSHAA